MNYSNNQERKEEYEVSRREVFGLGSSALAAALALSGSKQASAAPWDSNAAANHNAPNETDPGHRSC